VTHAQKVAQHLFLGIWLLNLKLEELVLFFCHMGKDRGPCHPSNKCERVLIKFISRSFVRRIRNFIKTLSYLMS
jgi:hypothetical protein